MEFRRLAIRDTPRHLTEELKRYGGINPFGEPVFRVVLAQNVRDQSFGTMRHMPVINADSDIIDPSPERFTAGEHWLHRYDKEGWILERWFPEHAWGSQYEWEHETAQDEVTKLKGAFPAHGDYFMVNDIFHVEQQGADYWKGEIQKCIRAHADLPADPASVLSCNMYIYRLREQQRKDDYADEVNHIHRTVTDPMLATIGRTAQLVRDGIKAEMGYGFHLAAG